jgi:ferric-dicitrate binding protein FerR (iron transport regulator)
MNTQEQEKIIGVISKVLNDNASAVDRDFLIDWINQSDLNNTYFQQLKEIWEQSGKSVDFSTVSSQKALINVFRKTNTPKIHLWRQWQKIAAVIIIPLLLVNLYYFIQPKINEYSTYVETVSPNGTRSTIDLPDGSKVWLNSGASLRYPNQFGGNTRKVYLNGEGYFEVKSDAATPFIVESGSMEIIATGTRFNVQNWNNGSIEVTLAEGKVSVYNSGNKLTSLQPSQRLVLNTLDQKYITSDEDVYRYISWKDGKLIFRNDPLGIVVSKLSNFYHVDIELNDEQLSDFRYRATFENESIDEILKLIERTSPIKVVEQKSIQNPNGEYQKRKFMVFPIARN